MHPSLPDCDPPLSIRLLGALEVRLSGQPLPRLRSRKGDWLLALLILREGQPVLRDWLAETLWPEVAPDAALTSLRQSLKDLRAALGDQAWRLQAAGGRALLLDLDHVQLDLREFQAELEAGNLERAVRLYRGPLLEGCHEPWVQPHREQFEGAYLHALERLSRQAEARGDLALAAGYLRQAAATAPGSEPVHRALMSLLSRGGETQAAIETYQRLRRWLYREYATEPDPETTALYQQLRKGALPSGRKGGAEAPRHSTATGVPLPLTSLVGRERELAEIETRLATERVVTLLGTGGVGKTRLALAAAAELAPQFADGACFVDFSPVGSEALLRSTVAAALGLGAGPDPEARLLSSLAPRQLLLVLDNCEHLLQGCARLVLALVTQCPALRVLATSREALGITGEVRVPIQPLPLPDAATTDDRASLQRILASPAVRLFCERAAAVCPVFSPTEAEAATLLQLCRSLDGLPLALELAASQLDVLSLPELVRGLDDRFRFLSSADPTRPERQQTLRGVVDWSYERLDPEEQRLFRSTAVFTGSWSLAALEAVCGAGSPPLFPMLARLVRKSLVVPEELHRGDRRYRMLETLRQYALERLTEAGEADAVRRRHLAWLTRLAAEIEPQLSGPEQRVALDHLAGEDENLTGALEWALSPERDVALAREGARLAVSLGRYWQVRGLYRQGRRQLHRSLERLSSSAEEDLRLRAALLGWSGFLALYEGCYQEATEHATAALRAWETLGDARGRAEALGTLAISAKDQGHPAEACALFQESVGLWEQLGDSRGVASALGYLGILAGEAGDPRGAEALFERSLALRRSLRDTWGIAASLNNLGRLAASRGDRVRGRALLEESLSLRRQLGDRRNIAITLNSLGSLRLDQEELAQAAACFAESLELVREIGDRRSLAYSLEAAAQVALCLEEAEDGLRLLGAAAALRSELPAPLPAKAVAAQERLLERLRKLTGGANSERHFSSGEALGSLAAGQVARAILQRASGEAPRSGR